MRGNLVKFCKPMAALVQSSSFLSLQSKLRKAKQAAINWIFYDEQKIVKYNQWLVGWIEKNQK
jgi:hypothetical protein